MSDDNKNRGLYHKFDVKRTDGTSEPGGKHADTHDKFAGDALAAYATACQGEYPALANDLWAKFADIRQDKRLTTAIRRALNAAGGDPYSNEEPL